MLIQFSFKMFEGSITLKLANMVLNNVHQYMVATVNEPGPVAGQMQRALKETVLLPPLFCF
jgi:hypothetical protein